MMFKAQKTSDISVQEVSLIGSDIKTEGSIESPAAIHLAGTHQGDVTCKSLIVEQTGSVTGKIEGSLSYKRIEIEDGATVEGQFMQKKSPAPAAKE